MNKDEFNELSIERQVSCLNKLLKKDPNITKACKTIGMARSTVSDRFKNHNYVRIDNQYIKNTDVKHDNITKIIKTKYQSNTNVKDEIVYDSVVDEKHIEVINVKNPLLVEKLPLAEKKYSEELLLEMIEWYRKYRDVLVIDPKPINEGEGSTRSFKVDSKILSRFISFCENNSQYSQKDLLSWALYLMMEKYDK